MPIPSSYNPGPPAAAKRARLVALACRVACACLFACALSSDARADRLHLVDGTTIEADEAWDDPHGVWYRQGGVSYLLERARVKKIERAGRAGAKAAAAQTARVTDADAAANLSGVTIKTSGGPSTPEAARGGETSPSTPVMIYLVGGASFEVDEVNETADGLWYKRGALAIFIDRARVERVERERPEVAEAGAAVPARRERRWSTGRARLDSLIRQNGARYGVDPYLVFCVMEQESHFNARAVSPVGARGLMQLMPGTAARFGVRNAHDPAQSVTGGTRYLKELLNRFNGRVDLVLAGYNAGEGAVMKYGRRVPPYRETRNYVRRITQAYGSLAHAPAPRREADKGGAEKAAPKK